MNLKPIIFLIIPTIIVSCSNTQQEEAKKIIADFCIENRIDNRETIFDIQATTENGIIILNGETDQPELKNKLLASFGTSIIEDKINIIPDSTVGKKTFGLINLSVANLRSAPKHSAELATQALMGTPVKILKIKEGWLLIQTPDKYISWIDSDGVVSVSEIEMEKWRNTKRLLFTGDNETIYETPNFENPVSDITLGSIIEEIERVSNKIKVMLPDGRTGFTNPSNWVDFNDFKNMVQPDTTQIKNMAMQLLGRPYLWGGTSARAMDCSGFVKTIYFMNGIILARDASQQTRYGEIVEPATDYRNLQTGDLLFFGQKQSIDQPEKVTHVAISLGNTEYINAAGKIKRNSFNSESKIYSEYRTNSFVRARRVIGFANDEGIQTAGNHPWY